LRWPYGAFLLTAPFRSIGAHDELQARIRP
jgi:hypothetical protein